MEGSYHGEVGTSQGVVTADDRDAANSPVIPADEDAEVEMDIVQPEDGQLRCVDDDRKQVGGARHRRLEADGAHEQVASPQQSSRVRPCQTPGGVQGGVGISALDDDVVGVGVVPARQVGVQDTDVHRGGRHPWSHRDASAFTARPPTPLNAPKNGRTSATS